MTAVPSDCARSLQGPLLAAVSRSFYLSLRFLPPPVRAPLSVSYLLARAADTIADVAALPAAERLGLLAEFRAVLAGGAVEPLAARAAAFAAAVDHPGERELLERLAECFAQLRPLTPGSQSQVREVLGHILDGMELDLQRFPDTAPLRCLGTEAELAQYTWQVAGCVGEFWTAICAAELPGVFTRPVAEMAAWGKSYGQALQLINILRDQAGDAAIGRCYLPETALREAGLAGAVVWPARDWAPWHQVRGTLLGQARLGLAAGWRYAAAQRSIRLRFATLMPLLIGGATLDQLEALPEDGPPRACKIARPLVKKLGRRALWMALSGRIAAPPASP